METSTRTATRAVRRETAAGDLVVVREHELDTDLESAIRRIRADEVTARARILIVGADPDRDGPRGAECEDDFEPRLALGVAALSAHREERRALAAIGARFERLADSLDVLGAEAAHAIVELADGAAEAPRARLQRGVRQLGELLEWAREVAGELRVEADFASAGMRPCDLAQVVAEGAPAAEARWPGVRVLVDASGAPWTVRGRADDLAEMIALGLALVGARIGWAGAIGVSADDAGPTVAVTIAGFGEPHEVAAPESIARFRDLVHAHGGRVGSPPDGVGVATLVIELPRLA